MSREDILVAFPKNVFVDSFALNALAALYRGLDQLQKEQNLPPMLHFEMRQDASGHFQILITFHPSTGHPDQLEVSGMVSLDSKRTETSIHFGEPYDCGFTYRYDIRAGRATFSRSATPEKPSHA